MNPDQFTQQVLGALRLDACDQAQDLLDEYADKSLPPLHDGLTRQHLENCAQCRALHATMVTMNTRLPTLQSLRAPAGFTASVMHRTVYQRAASAPVQKPRRTIAWLMRPRIAFESAYAMTVVVMLFSGLTGVNAFDIDLWEQAGPRLLEQQSKKIETTYDNTTDAIQTWTQEKYTALTERLAELTRPITND